MKLRGEIKRAVWAALLVVSLSSMVRAEGAGDAVRGKRLFLQCQACHSMTSEVSGNVGPPLKDVVGRKAAAVRGYAYSSALSASNLVWSEANLDQWLERPNGLVPGTKMLFAGVAAPADRLALIAYLKSGSP